MKKHDKEKKKKKNDKKLKAYFLLFKMTWSVVSLFWQTEQKSIELVLD